MFGTIGTVDVDGATVVILRGEHDLATSLGLGGLIERSFDQNPYVIVDMGEATFIDSTVLRALLTGHRRMLDGPGHRFALVAGPGTIVDRALRLVDFCSAVPTYSSREAALDALGSAQPSEG